MEGIHYPRDSIPALGPSQVPPIPLPELPLIIDASPLSMERGCYHPRADAPHHLGNENKMRGSQSSTGLNIGLKPAADLFILFFLVLL